MPKETMFTLKLEPELRKQFMAEAEATHRPASQIVREFMRDFVKQQRAAREHDAWFRAEVEQGIREANDPNVKRIPHEEISAKWRRQRTKLVKRAGERPSEG
jgi:predicted transcriptional regulator